MTDWLYSWLSFLLIACFWSVCLIITGKHKWLFVSCCLKWHLWNRILKLDVFLWHTSDGPRRGHTASTELHSERSCQFVIHTNWSFKDTCWHLPLNCWQTQSHRCSLATPGGKYIINLRLFWILINTFLCLISFTQSRCGKETNSYFSLHWTDYNVESIQTNKTHSNTDLCFFFCRNSTSCGHVKVSHQHLLTRFALYFCSCW